MKILVLGSYYSPNLGDGVICICTAEKLRQMFPAAEVIIEDVLDRKEFDPGIENKIEFLKKRRNRQKLREIATKYFHWDKVFSSHQFGLQANWEHIEQIGNQSWDIVVFAGGQLFMDSYGLIVAEYLEYFNKQNTPVFFHAMGTGPSDSKKIQDILKNALTLDCVKMISSRDNVDKIRTVYKQQAKVTFDPALDSSNVFQITKKKDADTIGLGMMFTNSISTEKAVKFWIELIRELNRQGHKWKIFVNGSLSDVAFARYVVSVMPELKKPLEAYMVSVPGTPDELIKTVSQFRSLISFRLHSHIIAASLDIPSIAVVWDEKLNFFMEKIGCKERCCQVTEKPVQILEKLSSAEKQGYDREFLEKQVQYADCLLKKKINTVIENG
ncbi:MAG: polysaccharide pyruvyl transferase family protein [Lachnospiraceae bacterium]|nr:polysaccharide pyruvyl transferase family protein [Lachnospiraceae bacterium]